MGRTWLVAIGWVAALAFALASTRTLGPRHLANVRAAAIVDAADSASDVRAPRGTALDLPLDALAGPATPQVPARSARCDVQPRACAVLAQARVPLAIAPKTSPP